MSPNSADGPTELLRAWSQGDGSALDRLMPLVYDELHGLAQRYMRQERPDHTLPATSLVNEAYLRLIDVNRVEFLFCPFRPPSQSSSIERACTSTPGV